MKLRITQGDNSFFHYKDIFSVAEVKMNLNYIAMIPGAIIVT